MADYPGPGGLNNQYCQSVVFPLTDSVEWGQSLDDRTEFARANPRSQSVVAAVAAAAAAAAVAAARGLKACARLLSKQAYTKGCTVYILTFLSGCEIC